MEMLINNELASYINSQHSKKSSIIIFGLKKIWIQ